MSGQKRTLRERLNAKIASCDDDELRLFVRALERMDEYDDNEDEAYDDGSDDDDEEADDDEADEISPSEIASGRAQWPGSIRLRSAPDRRSIVAEDDVAKLHALASRGIDDPRLIAAHAASVARRQAFGDMIEQLGRVRPPYSREMIIDIIHTLDDPPQGTALQEPPKPDESVSEVSALVGQWKCVCGWRNSALRKKCRNCHHAQRTA